VIAEFTIRLKNEVGSLDPGSKSTICCHDEAGYRILWQTVTGAQKT
jgi:hypothetical protein